MHRMFAFKDLAANEDLIELRKSDGEFSMIVFDPVEAIETYYKNNPKSLILASDNFVIPYMVAILSEFGINSGNTVLEDLCKECIILGNVDGVSSSLINLAHSKALSFELKFSSHLEIAFPTWFSLSSLVSPTQ